MLAQQSIASATVEGDPEGAAERLLRLALAEALYGNLPAARHLVPKALSMSSERTLLARAARVLAEAGDVPGARALVDQAAREFATTDTMERQIFLSTVRAAIELGLGQPAAAVQALVPTDQYGDGCVCGPYLRYQRYVRAYARAGTGQTAQAMADFRALVDATPTDFDVLAPFAYLGLARVAGKSGDGAIARKTYQDLLAIWKDADGDLPTVKLAKLEYAALK